MIKRIVLTGGPGSGKTSSIQRIVKHFEGCGLNVVVVPETATELILGGLRPFGDKAIKMVDFQELVLRLQLAKEEIYELGIKYLPNTADTIIIYDRGLIDNRSYVSQEEFNEVMARVSSSLNYDEMLNRYDAVIDLVSDSEYYRTDNNEARSESNEMALEQGKKTLTAWMGHRSLKVVMPKEDFDDKVQEIIDFICGELQTSKIIREGKYLVDLTKCGELLQGKVLDITQCYLMSDERIEKRLRKVECEGRIAYYLTVFKFGESKKKLVSDRLINEQMYNELLEFRDLRRRIIHKKRYISLMDGEVYSLDVFLDNPLGLLEVNLQDGKKFDVTNPYVIDDVTDDENYRNKNIALNDNWQLLFKR